MKKTEEIFKILRTQRATQYCDGLYTKNQQGEACVKDVLDSQVSVCEIKFKMRKLVPCITHFLLHAYKERSIRRQTTSTVLNRQAVMVLKHVEENAKFAGLHSQEEYFMDKIFYD